MKKNKFIKVKLCPICERNFETHKKNKIYCGICIEESELISNYVPEYSMFAVAFCSQSDLPYNFLASLY